MGYLCAYYRYYYPVEFITAFLNDAANDDDIATGTALAKQKGIHVEPPRFGISKSGYFYQTERRTIAKGLSSVKYMGEAVADELYDLSTHTTSQRFSDLLHAIDTTTSLDARQLEILIKIDFFSAFGNQRELFAICDVFQFFKKGEAKKLARSAIDGTQLEEIVRRHATWTTKAGAEAKSYTLCDIWAILHECEDQIMASHVSDLSPYLKAKNFADIMGYSGYVSGAEQDRNKLYVRGVFPVRRKRDDVIFGYSVLTQSIGSGKESRMTVFKKVFEKDPIKEGDVIVCKGWQRDGPYFQLTRYEHMLA